VNQLAAIPDGARALFVCAHGAGAGMRHPFLEGLSAALGARRIGTVRYEFEYMEAGRRRVDPPAVATARVRAAVEAAARLAPGLPLLAGGKSFGGRMTSEAQAAAPLPGVTGLVLVGFPLHPAGKPGTTRADHLDRAAGPMLFLQGDRDELARLDLLRPVLDRLGARLTLHVVEGADHSFRVRGRRASDVLGELADAMVRWLGQRIG
jgi:predicted alpha/beta-hydrolase family hydrolase